MPMTYTERFNDIAVTQLNTQGFEQLTDRQQKLAYYLAQAGLWGRYISLDQGSEYNVPMFRALLSLHAQLKALRDTELHCSLFREVHESLYLMFAHNGVYHSTTGAKLDLPLSQAKLASAPGHPQANLTSMSQAVAMIQAIWFTGVIKSWRTVQTEGVDVVARSGANFYKGLTTEEVQQWRAANYPQDLLTGAEDPEVPPYGFNERLSRAVDGGIRREVVCANGLYGPYVQKIIENLGKALEFAENDSQRASLSTLIDFYQSGTAEAFDNHCVAWVKDQASSIYFINGLIESYDDPLGICCGFESIVAFKNPLQTAKVEKIIDHIQWFEDSMPFDARFKKEKAQGLSASSITVVSMAGETAPSLPLGINLPNSDWIRKKHGSKSVNLENSASSRSGFEKPLRDALYLPQYQNILEKYLNLTNGLTIDLHEIAGHGSGKLLPGVNTDVLGAYYSVIEECRADLVALYFIADEKLKQFGIYDSGVDVQEAALAQYVVYITNGAFGQLRRISAGQDLTQAHFRNRQLISLWLLEHADPERLRLVTAADGRVFVEVNDVEHVRELVGQLLAKIQEIKSTGDFEAGRDLVMTYGTKVDQALLQEVHQRVAALDMPKTVCFVTPVLEFEGDAVTLRQVDNFFEQQAQLFNDYCSL